jgi:hypothetical protein
VNSVFPLRALAAQKMLQVLNHPRCHAAGKPAIHARRSKTNSAISQTADKAPFHSSDINGRVRTSDE